MLIACKYEEIWPPLIKDYIHISDNAYSKNQIISMEISMLTELDFNVNFVSSHSFLERYIQISKTDKVTRDLAQYMLEIALLDYSSIHIKPSYLAMSSLYLAKKIMKYPTPWDKKLAEYTFYNEQYVSSLSWIMLNLLKSYQRPTTKLEGLMKKFGSDEFSCVSTYFQFESQTSSKNHLHTEREHTSKRTGDITTDKKKTISADKLKSQKTLSSTQATSTKKGF